ncbi:MAG: hypothetical protein Q4Q04_06500 [Methanocorpusculum sp.]|nr:hypothetical protein [Methanocorpusculum sp.]
MPPVGMFLTKTERRAALILAGVTIALLLMYAGITVFLPEEGAVPYSPSAADGSRVVLTGEVFSSKLTSTGGHVLLNVSGVSVFIEGGAERMLYFLPGDRVKVVGTMATYAGKREISVGTTGSVEIL